MRGALGHVAVLESKHLQDGHALEVVLAIVGDPDGHLSVLTVSAGGLHGAPLRTSDAVVLIFNTFDVEEVADGLGTALDVEVGKLRHFFQGYDLFD